MKDIDEDIQEEIVTASDLFGNDDDFDFEIAPEGERAIADPRDKLLHKIRIKLAMRLHGCSHEDAEELVRVADETLELADCNPDKIIKHK